MKKIQTIIYNNVFEIPLFVTLRVGYVGKTS